MHIIFLNPQGNFDPEDSHLTEHPDFGGQLVYVKELAQAMAEDVLTVLQAHAGIARITLVSDDPGAGLLAQKYGADCWSEKSLGCRGLNALIQCASVRLLGGGQVPLLVLHADLPLLGAADI